MAGYEYDFTVVLISFLIATSASYISFNLVNRIRLSNTNARLWLYTGSMVMGLGVWSMHFMGMQALEVSYLFDYSVPISMVSVLPVILASYIVLLFASRDSITRTQYFYCVLAASSGVLGMHYIGMLAINDPVRMSMDPLFVLLSVVVAFLTTTIAIFLIRKYSDSNVVHQKKWQLISACVMGLSIIGVHYAGMMGTEYAGLDVIYTQDKSALSSGLLSYSIGTLAVLFLVICSMASGIKGKMTGKQRLGLLIMIMTMACALVAILSINLLFVNSYEKNRKHLTDIVFSQASLVDAVARFDATHSQDAHEQGAMYATISQVSESYKRLDAVGDSGEMLLFGAKDNDFVIFAQTNKNIDLNNPPLFKSKEKISDVMSEALLGFYGFTESVDDEGKDVFVAYASSIEYELGMLAKLDVDEFIAPFVRAAITTVLLAVMSIILGGGLFFKLNNSMIRQLKNEIAYRSELQSALESVNENLEHRVSLRTMELETAVMRANDAAKAKSEFLANMSHEIRTPMNGVLGMLTLVRETELTEDQIDLISTAYNSGESLLAILNDILDLSKIDAGKMELEEIDFDPRQVIEEVATLFASNANSKSLELLCHIDSNVPSMVKGDATRLRQIISNLVGNAVKFTGEGEISIHSSVKKYQGEELVLYVEVKDTGIGIDSSVQESVFESFSQADASTTRKFGGTGLGLTISSKLCELMGGAIAVESKPDAGSKFWFEVRFRKSPACNIDFKPHAYLNKLKTLIVDDNKTNVKILEHYLSSWGVPYESAYNGVDALEKIEEESAKGVPYELVLLDMQMPGLDGLQVAAKLRESISMDQLKIIMLTSISQNDLRKNCEGIINTTISKPVRQSLLYNNIITLTGDYSTDEIKDKESTGDKKRTEIIQEKYVLVAEDNLVNQKVITGMLKQYGIKPFIANNGQEAVDELKKSSYALVFMDCQMPVLDGYKATREIRMNPEISDDILVVAMTANAMRGDREKCIDSGMDDYISKPVRPAELDKIMKKWLGRILNEKLAV